MRMDTNQYHWFKFRDGRLRRSVIARRKGQPIDPPETPKGATYYGAHTKRAVQYRELFQL
jgi:hypothetical protein